MKKVSCDTCNKKDQEKNLMCVFGGIVVCQECIHKIIALYVYINPIKILCPLCSEQQSDTEECSYCDIPLIEKIQQNVANNKKTEVDK